MRRLACRSTIVVLVALLLFGGVVVTDAQTHRTINYGSTYLESNGVLAGGNLPGTWDVTTGPLTISFSLDMTGLEDDLGGSSAHAWPQLGLRQVGSGYFNPNNTGIWLAADYDWTAGTFNPDPPGSPNFDLDDKFTLQYRGGYDESRYDRYLPGGSHRPLHSPHQTRGATTAYGTTATVWTSGKPAAGAR